MGLIDVSDAAGIRTVRFADPDGRNALDRDVANALVEALAVPGSIHVVVLCGSAEVFCSGASPSVLADLPRGRVEPAELRLPLAVLGAPVPVIAAMEGHAIGGGLVLGVSADVVLVAEESRYGATFMDLGFTPGMGATTLLERVMSPAQAHEMLLTGEPRRGRDLRGHGFNYVLPRDQVADRAFELARRLADLTRPTLVRLKATLTAPWIARFEGAHAIESAMHDDCFREVRHA